MADQIQKVVTPNQPHVYMTGLQLVYSGQIYQLPAILIPDGFELQVQASPLNAANILIAPQGAELTIFTARILRPGEWVSYRIQNASELRAQGLAANLVLNLSCEYGG